MTADIKPRDLRIAASDHDNPDSFVIPTNSELSRLIAAMQKNKGYFGSGDNRSFVGSLAVVLANGDKTQHQDGDRVEAIARTLVRLGFFAARRDDLGNITRISFLQDPSENGDNSYDRELAPELKEFDSSIILASVAAQLLAARRELAEKQDDKDYLDSLAAENDDLRVRAENAEAKIADLKARPESDELKAKVAELEAQLAVKDAELKVAEIRIKNRGEMLDAERASHGKTKELLESYKDRLVRQGGIIDEIALTLGVDNIPQDSIPDVLREASDRFKEQVGYDYHNVLMNFLAAFGFDEALEMAQRFIGDEDEETVLMRDLLESVIKIDEAMEQIPKKSIRKYNAKIDERNRLIAEINSIVIKWRRNYKEQVTSQTV